MKNTEQAPEADDMDSGVLSNPLSFSRSGFIYWVDASQRDRSFGGYYWSLYSANTGSSGNLYFYITRLYPETHNNRGTGFAVRCIFCHHIEREGQLFRGCPQATAEDKEDDIRNGGMAELRSYKDVGDRKRA